MNTAVYFATAPAPLAPLLERELTALGARRVRARGAGVEFTGDLAVAYRACLWSRLASRVLFPLARIEAPDGDALYEASRAIAWEDHLRLDTTFAVDCTLRQSRISHSHFAALRVKDAIVDRFREMHGARPNVDTRSPDIRVQLHLRGNEGRLALDLCGESLHRRGYRTEAGPAPVRETLGAAVLALAGWPDDTAFGAFLDPLCGSGTLVVEAGLMAGDVAPGLTRTRFGFLAWGGHDAALWGRLLDEARGRRERGLRTMPDVAGSDRDPVAVATAEANLRRAGLSAHARVSVRALEDYRTGAAPARHGLLATNPPYGGRLDDADARECRNLLNALADGPMRDWTVAMLLPDDPQWPPESAGRRITVSNGALPCRIHVLEPGRDRGTPGTAVSGTTIDVSALVNRVTKNRRRLAAWRRREGVGNYRVYDADLPEFAFAVDVYESGGVGWAHVQEYAAPAQIPQALATARREAALAALPAVLDVEPHRLVFKTRERQRGARQYQRQASRGEYLEVHESGARLLVNLHDHLDTGLFLDHRPLRGWIRSHAAGIRFLNLFAYTGTATVHAALGGARSSLSVDLSASYLDWATRNLALNGFGAPHHRVEQADCVRWLTSSGAASCGPFDVVLMDPPTFSNSKRMTGTFDVQRDHVALLRAAADLLAPEGTLVFSTNRRGFRIDLEALADMNVHDWTRASTPPDFSRPAAAHRCWLIRAGGERRS